MSKPLHAMPAIVAPDPIEGVMLRTIETIRRRIMELEGVGQELDIHEADTVAECAVVTALELGWRPPVN